MPREARLIEVDKIVLGSIFIGDIIQFRQEYEKEVIDFVFPNEIKLRCLSTDVITEINMNTLHESPSCRVLHESEWTYYAEVLEKDDKTRSLRQQHQDLHTKSREACLLFTEKDLSHSSIKMDSDRMEAKTLLYNSLYGCTIPQFVVLRTEGPHSEYYKKFIFNLKGSTTGRVKMNTTGNLDNPITKVRETLVNGTNINEMNDRQLIAAINQFNREIDELEAVQANSVALDKHVKRLYKAIDVVVTELDKRAA